MIAHLYDPVESRRYDSAMLVLSFLIDQLNKFSYDQNVFCVYSDPTYPLRRHLQVSLAKKNLIAQEKAYNTSMSRVRL